MLRRTAELRALSSSFRSADILKSQQFACPSSRVAAGDEVSSTAPVAARRIEAEAPKVVRRIWDAGIRRIGIWDAGIRRIGHFCWIWIAGSGLLPLKKLYLFQSMFMFSILPTT